MTVDSVTFDTTPITGTPARQSLKDLVQRPVAQRWPPPPSNLRVAGTASLDVITRPGTSPWSAVPVSGLFALEAATSRPSEPIPRCVERLDGLCASSGTSPIATTTNSAVQALAADAVNTYYHIRICNESAAPGFYSVDGGTTWSRLPASSVIRNDGVAIVNKAIQVKRVADGTNLSAIYVEVWRALPSTPAGSGRARRWGSRPPSSVAAPARRPPRGRAGLPGHPDS